MGSCDFSLSSYSYDDTVDDFAMEHFDKKATRDRETIIPFILRASQAAGEKLRLFGTPWSPPFWMKTNNNMNGTSSPCIKVDSGDRYHKAWALYFLNVSTATIDSTPRLCLLFSHH
jgi:glucosylceramidase